MNAIAPGVYTKITTLEKYVEEVPSSTGFIAIISDRGPDNKLVYVTSREHFLKQAGEPNVDKYGVKWAHGSLVAERFMSASPSMYYIRVLPDDATYSNRALYLTERKPIKFGNTDGSPYQEKTFFMKKSPYVFKQSTDTNGNLTGFEITFPVETKIEAISDLTSLDKLQHEFADDKLKAINDAYVDAIVDGVRYIYKIYQDKLQLVAVNENDPILPVLVTNSSDVVQLYLEVTDTPDENTVPVAGTSKFVKLKAKKLGDLSATDSIPKLYVYNFDKTKIFEIVPEDNGSGGYTLLYNEITDPNDLEVWNKAFALYAIHGEGRGSGYNNLFTSVRPIVNKTKSFYFSLYEVDKNGQYSVVGAPQYEISFDNDIVDEYGENIFIENVINNYIDYIDIYLPNDNVGNIKATVKSYIISRLHELDTISEWRYSNGYFKVKAVVSDLPEDARPGYYYAVSSYGTGDLFGYDGKIITLNAAGEIVEVDKVSEGSIIIDENDDIYFALENGLILTFNPLAYCSLISENKDDDVTQRYLKLGSDGSLFNPDTNLINENIATTLLVRAYSGLIDESIRNTEFVWIDLSFCPAYPKEVKDAAVQLANERRDHVLITDIGDNLTPQDAVNSRLQKYPYNSEFVALYDPYTKVNNPFNGKDIWVSPVYHMAYLIAMNDKINEVWYATAGYPEGVISEIKEMRYSPDFESEQSDFYLNQINPIVKFRDGYVVWGQLTTYREPCALQDVNIVRCILYIKRALKNYFRREIFDFNDPVTWMQMENGANSFLKQVKELRGLYDYDINIYANDYMRRRKMAKVNLMLEPTRVLEKIFFNISVR